MSESFTLRRSLGFGCGCCGASLPADAGCLIRACVLGVLPCCGGVVDGRSAVRLIAAARLLRQMGGCDG